MQARVRTTACVLPLGSEADLRQWQRLDDVIMGGQSSSTLEISNDGAAVFSGTLVLEGGGFCGARTNVRAPPWGPFLLPVLAPRCLHSPCGAPDCVGSRIRRGLWPQTSR